MAGHYSSWLAGPKDLALATDLFRRSTVYWWGERADADRIARETAEAILDGSSGCRMLIARWEDRPSGFATFALLHPGTTGAGTLFLKDLLVVEEARGSGLGARIMQSLAQIAQEAGCARFDWTAETDNPGALAFYDRLGARRVTEKVYFRLAGDEIGRLADGT